MNRLSIRERAWKSALNFFLPVAESILLSMIITITSVVIGGLSASLHSELVADQTGIAVMERSLFVIVLTQFALTGALLACLLRGKASANAEVFALLIIPVLIFVFRFQVADYLEELLYLSNLLVIWRILVIRRKEIT